MNVPYDNRWGPRLHEDGTPVDGGPIYTESNFAMLIVEELNALSAFLFLGVVVYWLWKLRHNLGRPYRFIVISMVIMAVGGIGGTVYHAIRTHEVWLMMDWLPIAILVFAGAFYFWWRSTKRWWIAPLIFVPIFGLMGLLWSLADAHGAVDGDDNLLARLAPNIGYSMMGLYVLIPIILFMVKTNWVHGRLILYSLLSFVIAVTARTMDSHESVEVNLEHIGTHFLWHVFGALTAHLLVLYTYRINRDDVQPAPLHRHRPDRGITPSRGSGVAVTARGSGSRRVRNQ